MRVDGTLMGMDEDSKKMIPQWRRGHFSLLFDASTQPASVFICDHQKKLFANMAKKKKARDMDAEVTFLTWVLHVGSQASLCTMGLCRTSVRSGTFTCIKAAR